MVFFLVGKILDRLWQISNAIGQVFIDINGQMLKNNRAIWSHCSLLEGPNALGILVTYKPGEVKYRRKNEQFQWHLIG